MMTKVLFYSLDSAPLFDNSLKLPIGGAEIRAFNFATFLSRHGFDVYMIVAELSGDKKMTRNGITVLSPNYFKRRQTYLTKVRVKLHYLLNYRSRMTYDLFLRYSECFLLNPDYVCVFGITGNTRHAAIALKQRQTKIILFIASDEEINFTENENDTRLNTKFSDVKKFLSVVDLVFVQNKYQEKLASGLTKKSVRLLRSPVDLSVKCDVGMDGFLLWVGKTSTYKNPGLFVELSKAFPQHPFLMICNETETDPLSEIKDILPSNCTLVEHVSPDKIESYFSRCCIFVNTSDFEGFPNTFLQALKYGKPIVSFNVDPDNFISDYGCGVCCHGDKNVLINSLKELMSDTEVYNERSRNALTYIKNHDVEAVGQKLAEALAEL